MRRHLLRFLPLVALALLVQLVAPLGALRAAAAKAADPFATVLCEGGAAHDSSSGAAGDQHCCAFCAAGQHGGPALTAPPAHAAVLQRAFQRIAWLQSEADLRLIRPASVAQARAPPIVLT